MYRLLNVGLRAATLGSRFVLVFFLARFLEPDEVGLYGLLSAAVAYGLYLVGLDFYTYSTREILRVGKEYWGAMLHDQAALVLVLYGLMLPLLLSVFAAGFLPWSIAPWFYALLVLEHLSQELGRLLVTMSRQLMASLVLFFRSGLWGLVIISAMTWWPQMRHLKGVLAAWIVGDILALVSGFVVLRSLTMGGWRTPLDWLWVRRGVRVAVPLLIGTLALRALFTLDRYWFARLNSLSTLAAYVLFGGMCGALMSFLDAGVFSYAYPAMVAAHHRHDRAAFKREMRRMGLLTVLCCVGFVMSGIIVLEPLLVWLGKPVYLMHASLFYWLLLPTCLCALSTIPHYGLYAYKCDKVIVQSQIAGVLIFLLTTSFASLISTLLAVPIGLSAAFLFILAWKSAAFYKASASGLRTSNE